MVDTLKKYVENRIQLVKFELIGALANVGAGLFSSILLLVVGMFILLMFNFAIAFWLGQMFDSYALGFAIVGGVYTLIFIIYLSFSKDALETKVKDKIVTAALAGEEELFDNEENY